MRLAPGLSMTVMWQGTCSAEVGVSGPGCQPAGSECSVQPPFGAATAAGAAAAALGMAAAAAACSRMGGQAGLCRGCTWAGLEGWRSKPMPLLMVSSSSRDGTSGRPACKHNRKGGRG